MKIALSRAGHSHQDHPGNTTKRERVEASKLEIREGQKTDKSARSTRADHPGDSKKTHHGIHRGVDDATPVTNSKGPQHDQPSTVPTNSSAHPIDKTVIPAKEEANRASHAPRVSRPANGKISHEDAETGRTKKQVRNKVMRDRSERKIETDHSRGNNRARRDALHASANVPPATESMTHPHGKPLAVPADTSTNSIERSSSVAGEETSKASGKRRGSQFNRGQISDKGKKPRHAQKRDKQNRIDQTPQDSVSQPESTKPKVNVPVAETSQDQEVPDLSPVDAEPESTEVVEEVKDSANTEVLKDHIHRDVSDVSMSVRSESASSFGGHVDSLSRPPHEELKEVDQAEQPGIRPQESNERQSHSDITFHQSVRNFLMDLPIHALAGGNQTHGVAAVIASESPSPSSPQEIVFINKQTATSVQSLLEHTLDGSSNSDDEADAEEDRLSLKINDRLRHDILKQFQSVSGYDAQDTLSNDLARGIGFDATT